MPDNTPVVAIIGATGALGGAIARRLVKAGEAVVIGSRDGAKASAAAAALAAETGRKVGSGANADAAAAGDIVIVAVPFASQKATLTEIASAVAGKIVVDTTVPLVPPKVMRVQLPPEDSAALIAQNILGPGVDRRFRVSQRRGTQACNRRGDRVRRARIRRRPQGA